MKALTNISIHKRLIIFDVDGVLEDERIIGVKRSEAVIKEVARKNKLSIEEAKQLYCNTKQKLVKANKTASVDISIDLGFTRKDHFRILDSVNPKGIIKQNPNCELMLKSICNSPNNNNTILVAYSNSSRASTEKALKVLKIDKYINKLYSSEDFKESKPSINNLKAILKESGVSAKDSIYVGNSYEKDIIPAHTVGIKTILYDQFKEFKKYVEVDYLITDLVEIIEITKYLGRIKN